MFYLGTDGAGFRSLTEAIDTTNAAGRMMMQMPDEDADPLEWLPRITGDTPLALTVSAELVVLLAMQEATA